MFCGDVYDSGYDEYDKDFEEHHNEDECVEIVQERPVGGKVWLADRADGTGEGGTDTGGYIWIRVHIVYWKII